jgi:homoserine O-succinyltransferase
MPIKINSSLPAYQQLIHEGVFVMSLTRAYSQVFFLFFMLVDDVGYKTYKINYFKFNANKDYHRNSIT